MIININDYTNTFVSTLASNTTKISDGLTANELLNAAGINFINVPSKQIGSTEARSQEQRLVQYYTLNFDLWYPIAKYALSNVANADSATARFAQQLAARFVPLFALNASRISNIISPTARVHSELVLPSYTFVPSLISSFSSPLYGRSFGAGKDYIFEARFPTDYMEKEIILGIYDYKFSRVESTKGTVDRDGFVYFKWTPTNAIVKDERYFFAFDSFTIFDSKVYPALVSNVMASQFVSYNGIVSFVGA